jgi:putative phosphoribosyl transferase
VLFLDIPLFVLLRKAHLYSKIFSVKGWFSVTKKSNAALTSSTMVFEEHEIDIPITGKRLGGTLSIDESADGMVVFAHGSGSSRFSSRNRYVANLLQQAGFCTLLFDLLTAEEDREYANRFDISLISDRLIKVTRWVRQRPSFSRLPIGYFGASTGAAAALSAAAQSAHQVQAIVSCGGRPDLASPVLGKVQAPTLLLVGSLDKEVIALNEHAYALLQGEKVMRIIEGATHLFEEPGKLEEVAREASAWFSSHLKKIYA